MELARSVSERPMQFVARIANRNQLYCGLEFLATSDSAASELRAMLAS